MGMYTELVLSCRIKDNSVPVGIIKYMLGMVEEQPNLPDHRFFSCDRWAFMLKCSSYYFVPRNMSLFEYDDIGKYWCFVTRSDFKNYSNEIDEFIDWLRPYLEDDSERTFIGYSRYEEDVEPKLIYSKE